MGMVVRTNTMAINAYRQLGLNNSAVAKSLEKLASGYRINRAGDDAAGLAISEKMKAQITGLETASANAQDGISLIQTAEGNLSEVHDMLNRMVELATKSANGTYTQTERDALQDEVNQLLDEIDRISQSANFNGAKLLDGTMGLNTNAFTIGDTTKAVAGEKITLAGFPAKGTESLDGESPLHFNTAGQEQQGAIFAIDLADYKLDLTDATGTVKVTLSFSENPKDKVELEINADTAANKKEWTGADIAKAFAEDATWGNPATSPAGGKYAVMSHAFYKVENDGTQLKFTYAGASANQDKATPDDKITDTTGNDMTAINSKPVKDILIQADGGVESGASYHGVKMIQEAQVAVDGNRAGITLDLSQNADDLFQDGATLTVDGVTFTFRVSDAEVEGDNVIDLRGVDKTDYAAAAARQMSTTDTEHFVIRDGGSGKIRVDQTVEDYDGGDNAPYTTYESLTGLFSATKAATDATSSVTVTADKINSGDAITVGDKTFQFVEKASATPAKGIVEVLKGDGVKGLVDALNDNGFTAAASGDTVTVSKAGEAAPSIIGGGLTLQIGDTADSFNKMNVSVANMSAKGLGLDGLKITSETESSDAIARIKDAINTVSSTRAGMGALQNRLEHTINNLDVAAENLSAANSRIRDTDMAKEMMNYTKMNVLVQSAQAMLAQANQQPQSVLQLLQ